MVNIRHKWRYAVAGIDNDNTYYLRYYREINKLRMQPIFMVKDFFEQTIFRLTIFVWRIPLFLCGSIEILKEQIILKL